VRRFTAPKRGRRAMGGALRRFQVGQSGQSFALDRFPFAPSYDAL